MKNVNGIMSKHSETFKAPDFFAPSKDICIVNGVAKCKDLCQDCWENKSQQEISGAWGEFEGFSEFASESEIFYYKEELEDAIKHDIVKCDQTSSTQGFGPDQLDQSEWSTLIQLPEDINEYRQAFSLHFPDIQVEKCTDEIKSLQSPLIASNSEINIGEFINIQLRADWDSLEKDDADSTVHRFDWNKSMGCRNLLMMLGVDSPEKCVDGNQRNEECSLAKNEQLSMNEISHSTGNKALIQTKVAPDSRQGSIFSYQLFLKTESHPVLPFLTFSGKKSFF
ncbi:hypothetical protein GDO86_016109 [Hymenochirus boettgeri]|uniref:Aftiphilin clathrin-binding box domain-containing protein n=1 Tax=Hymenochirus boettgeri TaxID=247094 RepID=A0A8T2K3X2_9PIPI|nr:hypothetical protein GDO86_016109 [Hymenochirus boettgeri]